MIRLFRLQSTAVFKTKPSFLRTTRFQPRSQTISLHSRFKSEWTLVKPEPPEFCCGKGCHNCVWDQYFTDVREYEEQLAQFRKGNGLEEETEVDEIDPSVKAFYELERKLRENRE